MDKNKGTDKQSNNMSDRHKKKHVDRDGLNPEN